MTGIVVLQSILKIFRCSKAGPAGCAVDMESWATASARTKRFSVSRGFSSEPSVEVHVICPAVLMW